MTSPHIVCRACGATAICCCLIIEDEVCGYICPYTCLQCGYVELREEALERKKNRLKTT
jgi:hypothetical protein